MKRKERAEEILRYVENIRDQDGYAVVDVRLAEGASYYNPLGMGAGKDLCMDIYDYIDAETNIIPAEVPLRIRFHGEVPEEEQKEIREMMHRHYMMKSLDVSWDIMANFRKMILLTIFGVLILAAYFYFSLTTEIFFAEILSIVGSFSLWEAADSLLLERPRLRRAKRNLDQNLSQIIEFTE